MSDPSPERADIPPAEVPTVSTASTDAPPAPGPVFVPAGLGLPAGYYTPVAAPDARPQRVSFARRKFSLLVVGGGIVLGVLAGGVAGAGAMALVAGDHQEHSRSGSTSDGVGGIGEHGSGDTGR